MTGPTQIDHPRLTTERLVLRGWRDADLDDYAAMVGDAEAARWTNPGGKPLSREEAWRHMAMVAGHWALRGYGLFAVEEKASGRVVGRVGAWYPENWPGIELGWVLGPEARGKGYATEAGKACLDWMFDTLDLDRVISTIQPGNKASIAVAERLGQRFLEEGRIVGIPCLIYGIDRDGR